MRGARYSSFRRGPVSDASVLILVGFAVGVDTAGIDLDCALRDSGLEFSQHPLWFVGRIVLPFVAVICFGVGYGRWPGEVAGVTV